MPFTENGDILVSGGFHGRLGISPRKITPVIRRGFWIGHQEGSSWRLSVPIKHGARILDGLAVAEDAVNAWREKLTAWRLI